MVAVIRDGHVVVPTPDTFLHAADEVLILATGDVESELGNALIGNK